MRALSALINSPWCITEDALKTILTIAKREQPELSAVEAQLGRKLEYARSVTERGGVATIPVDGPIFRKANLFTSMSGATSIEILAKDFTTALHNPQVRAILLAIDSPGGEVTGVHEFAEMIHQARGVKPIVAYVEGLGASAAYWIASACDSIICDPTAMLGSIGVIAALDNSSDPNQLTFVSAKSPNKHPDMATDAGRAQIQALIDATADVFIADVARNRGVTTEAVIERFGAGGMKVGADAVTAGLADKLGSYEQALADLQNRRPQSTAVQATGPDLRESITVIPLNRTAGVPVVSPASIPARVPTIDRTSLPVKENRMSEDIQRPSEPATVAAIDVELNAAETAKIDRIVSMREQEWKAREARILQEADARFERRMAEERVRNDVENYAQHITTPTLTRQHALPGQAATYGAFLLSLNASQRSTATGLFDNILASGLVSFEEIGSGGEGEGTPDPSQQWQSAITAKVSAGLSRSAAIEAVKREQPALFAAYNASGVTKKGGR